MSDINEIVVRSQVKKTVYELDCERGSKMCNSCGNYKELDNFYIKLNPSFFGTVCKKCISEKKRAVKFPKFIEKDGIKLKWCAEHGEYFKLEKFHFYTKANKFATFCKECCGNRAKKYFKNQLELNGEEFLEKRKEIERKSRNKHKDKINESARQYRKSESGKLVCRERTRRKMKNDPHFRMRRVLMKRLNNALRASGLAKHARTMELLGCDIISFKIHIEKQFTKRMNWKNHGCKENNWNLEHILPIELFDLTDKRQQKVCFNYSNIKPVWSNENRAKSDWLDNGKRARNLSPQEKLEYLKSKGHDFTQPAE